MLSFNPISSQSRATQNLKNVRRGLFPLKYSLRRDGWQGGGEGAGRMCDQVLCPYLQHWHDLSVLAQKDAEITDTKLQQVLNRHNFL